MLGGAAAVSHRNANGSSGKEGTAAQCRFSQTRPEQTTAEQRDVQRPVCMASRVWLRLIAYEARRPSSRRLRHRAHSVRSCTWPSKTRTAADQYKTASRTDLTAHLVIFAASAGLTEQRPRNFTVTAFRRTAAFRLSDNSRRTDAGSTCLISICCRHRVVCTGSSRKRAQS